jgi:hypothetical protein
MNMANVPDDILELPQGVPYVEGATTGLFSFR